MQTQNAIKDYLHLAMREEEERRYLNNLVEALIAKLSIPEGCHLVALLGSGYERSNREALRSWAKRLRAEISAREAEGESALDYLEGKLRDRVYP